MAKMDEMRRILLAAVLVVVVGCGGAGRVVLAAVPSKQMEALEDIFNATNGRNWTGLISGVTPAWNESLTSPLCPLPPCLNNVGWKAYFEEGNKTADPCSECLTGVDGDGLPNACTGSIWSGGQEAGGGSGVVCCSCCAEALGQVNVSDGICGLHLGPFLGTQENPATLPTTIGYLTDIGALGFDLPPELMKNGGPAIFGSEYNTCLEPNLGCLRGPLPTEIGLLTGVRFLLLEFNQLSGQAPAEVGNMSSLGYLGFGHNKFTGTVPSELGKLSNLFHFGLNDAGGAQDPSTGGIYGDGERLWGTLPTELGNLGNSPNNPDIGLVDFDIDTSALTGPLPSELANFGNSFLNFYMYDTHIGGPIPSEFGAKWGSVEIIWLHTNPFLKGSIPESFGNLQHLTNFQAHNAALTGSLSSRFGNLSSLALLSLSNNNLDGFLPTELCNLNALGALFLTNNRFFGSIPPILSRQLKYFVAQGNEFTGQIPEPQVDDDGNCGLAMFLVASNKLSGTIPQNLSACSNLTDFDVSFNNIHGVLPGEWPARLETLNAEHNAISGTAPATLSDLSQMTSIKLGVNHLSCVCPKLPSVNGGTLDILTGNLFGCPLPPSVENFDVNVASYECGLTPFYQAFIATAVSFLAIIATVFGLPPKTGAGLPKAGDKGPASVDASRQTWVEVEFLRSYLGFDTWWRGYSPHWRPDTRAQTATIASCMEFLISSLKLQFVLTVVIVCVLVPTYWEATDSFQCEYGWETTMAFMGDTKSKTATLAATGCVVFFGIAMVLFWGSANPSKEREQRFLANDASTGSAIDPTRGAAEGVRSNTEAVHQIGGDANTFVVDGFEERKHRSLLFAVGFTFSVVPQGVYVWVYAQDGISTTWKLLAFWLTSFFKIVMNSCILPLAARALTKAFVRNSAKCFKTTIVVMTVILVLNSVFVPMTSVLLLDSRCYSNYIWPLPAVEETVTSKVCLYYNETTHAPLCPDPEAQGDQGWYSTSIDINFDFPFVLSDQCGTAVIERYTPIFVVSILGQSVLQPCLWLALSVFFSASSSSPKGWIVALVPSLIWSPDAPNFSDFSSELINGHFDMMYAKVAYVVTLTLTFGIVSPMVAVAGLVGMWVTAWVYMRLLGVHVKAAFARRDPELLCESVSSFGDKDDDDDVQLVSSLARLKNPAGAGAGLPSACSAIICLTSLVFIHIIFKNTFDWEPLGGWLVWSVVVCTGVAGFAGAVCPGMRYFFARRWGRGGEQRDDDSGLAGVSFDYQQINDDGEKGRGEDEVVVLAEEKAEEIAAMRTRSSDRLSSVSLSDAVVVLPDEEAEEIVGSNAK